jgi:hypothetical protein
MVINTISRSYGRSPLLHEGFNCIINLNKADLEVAIDLATQTIIKTERSQNIRNWYLKSNSFYFKIMFNSFI